MYRPSSVFIIRAVCTPVRLFAIIHKLSWMQKLIRVILV